MPDLRLTLKADPFRVRLYAGEELVATHPRCYEKRQVIEDWRHYVPLLVKKSFAVRLRLGLAEYGSAQQF